MIEKEAPGWWPDEEPDAHKKHACWLISFLDGGEQLVAAWPPLSLEDVLKAYRCADAHPS